MSSAIIEHDQPAQLPAVTSSRSVSMADMEKMAKALAGSGLFGVKTEQQALALMLVAQAQGISPATACVDFDIIQGKPAMTARAMLARFQQAGGVIEWLQYEDEVCEAAFSHPQCPKPINIKWTMKDAIRAGLTGKDNWKKYPRQMLSSRVMSEGVDRCYPAASGGFYPPEVVQDFASRGPAKGSANEGAGEELTAAQHERIKEVAGKVVEWIKTGSIGDAFLEGENAGLDVEEMRYLWSLLDSKQRSALKKEGERVRAALAAAQEGAGGAAGPHESVISEPQRKRLEARITELGYDRERVKFYCANKFGRAHFSELTQGEYATLDADLENAAIFNSAPAVPEASGNPAGAVVSEQAGAGTVTPDQAVELSDLCSEAGMAEPRFLKLAGAASFDKIPLADYAAAKKSLLDRIAKAAK